MTTLTRNEVDPMQPVSHAHQEESRSSHSASYRLRDPRRKSAFLASVLSLFPGLGQVYVGYYRQGFINAIVCGSLFSLLIAPEGYVALLPLGIIFLIFYEFYNVIDAGRRATLYNLTLDGIENIDLPDELTNGPLPVKGSYLLGGSLLLFGAVALSNTVFGLPLSWLEQYWPVLPMLMGGFLVYQAILDGRSDAQAGNSTDSNSETRIEIQAEIDKD